MSHFIALVLLPPHTVDILEAVEEVLKPYYSELEVEPYKEYLDQDKLTEEIRQLSEAPRDVITKLLSTWGVESLEELAKLNLGWDDQIDGCDEQGEYQITTINPQGKWDFFVLIEEQQLENSSPVQYPCLVENLPNDSVPYALVTPTGHWLEAGGEIGIQAFIREQLDSTIPISDAEIAWKAMVREIFNQYSDHFAVALNCHI